MAITEMIANRFIDELVIFFKGNANEKDKLDLIAFKVSRSLPLTSDEQFFMEMKVPTTLSKTFWSAAKSASTGKEFLDSYKQGGN